VDSLSVYTLENIKDKSCPAIYYWTDEEIMEEFLILKEMVEDAWFLRYEISNFARASKASIHNMVYWNMEPYIGLWLSAASFFGNKRRTNTWDIKQYLEGNWIDEQEIHVLNDSDLLIEEFFLRLRTKEGIPNLSKFISVLVPTHESLIATYTTAWLLECDGIKLRLTDEGMNVYNSIITDLLQKL
jgi:oxygen-independent coproporphyrinogen-3 oxidase